MDKTHSEDEAKVKTKEVKNQANGQKGKRTTMTLRKYRKATAKKRLLSENNNSGEGCPPVKKTNKVIKVKKKKTKLVESDETQTNKEGEATKTEESNKNNNNKEVDEEEDSKSYEVSETNTMTLEQFTDIVLASEGMTVAEKGTKEEPKSSNSKKEVEVPSPTNNNNLEKKHHNEMVANILQNKDLTVEVKPVRVKPVVLSPRQPAGNNSLYQAPPSSSITSLPSGNSVVVSVKPRLSSSCHQDKPVQQLPLGSLPSGPRIVEEWLQKMPKAKSPKLSKEANHHHHHHNHNQPPRCPSTEVLNLSTKNNGEQSPESTVTNSSSSGKTTQIYLRPISTIQDRPEAPPLVTISPRPWLNGHSHHHQYSPSPTSSPVILKPNTDQHEPKLHQHISPPTTHFNNHLLPQLSPPRLEIKRVAPASSHHDRLQANLRRIVGRAAPFESDTHSESVRARAIRDIQLAHTKDMHGNLPIHMSVLMRKPQLVKRYCCVLQVLDSSMDLLNDDKLAPLHLAVRDNSMEIIELLLAFGSDPIAKDYRGNTSLHMATATGSTECLKLLTDNVRSKDDLNEPNNFGITPLHIAMMNGDKVCTDILLRSGADPRTLNFGKFPPPVPKALTKRDNLDQIVQGLPNKANGVVYSR